MVSHLPSAAGLDPLGLLSALVLDSGALLGRGGRRLAARRPRAMLTLDAAAPGLHYLTGPRGGSKTTDAADTATKPRCWWEPSAGWWAGLVGLRDLIKVRILFDDYLLKRQDDEPWRAMGLSGKARAQVRGVFGERGAARWPSA